MKGLIEALTIFAKYTSDEYPTMCEHDVLYVLVDPAEVNEADEKRLGELGFNVDRQSLHFYSFRYGSA